MHGRPLILNSVLPFAYPHLLKLSRGVLRRECRAIGAFSSADCLHEVIIQHWDRQFSDSMHLYNFMVRAIERTLIDHVRVERRRRKRERRELKEYEEALVLAQPLYPLFEVSDVFDIDVALQGLRGESKLAEKATFFNHVLGLRNPEIEAVLRVSPITVNRELRFSAQWLETFWTRQTNRGRSRSECSDELVAQV